MEQPRPPLTYADLLPERHLILMACERFGVPAVVVHFNAHGRFPLTVEVLTDFVERECGDVQHHTGANRHMVSRAIDVRTPARRASGGAGG